MSLLKKIEISLLIAVLIFNLFFVAYLINPQITSNVIFLKTYDTKSPYDFIKEDNIYSKDNKLVINISNFTLSRYSPSGSMSPVLNENSTGVNIKPDFPERIHVGDIISYYQKQGGLIVHRVVEKNSDEYGVYFIVKGDNAEFSDKEKIRFKDIDSVLVAIIY